MKIYMWTRTDGFLTKSRASSINLTSSYDKTGLNLKCLNEHLFLYWRIS